MQSARIFLLCPRRVDPPGRHEHQETGGQQEDGPRSGDLLGLDQTQDHAGLFERRAGHVAEDIKLAGRILAEAEQAETAEIGAAQQFLDQAGLKVTGEDASGEVAEDVFADEVLELGSAIDEAADDDEA